MQLSCDANAIISFFGDILISDIQSLPIFIKTFYFRSLSYNLIDPSLNPTTMYSGDIAIDLPFTISNS